MGTIHLDNKELYDYVYGSVILPAVEEKCHRGFLQNLKKWNIVNSLKDSLYKRCVFNIPFTANMCMSNTFQKFFELSLDLKF